MMDPAVAALVGTAVGALLGVSGALGAAWINTTRSRTDKHRELMRDAYARGLEAALSVSRARTSDDLDNAEIALIESTGMVRLVGTIEAGDAFTKYAECINNYLETVRGEAKRYSFDTARSRMEEAFPKGKRDEIGETYKAFMLVARCDLGIRGDW